ncbi:MAG: endonuclease domain-containing protein [Pseudomonadota bacterium]
MPTAAEILTGAKLPCEDSASSEATSTRPTCPDCHRCLSTISSLQQHREKYCRYRKGKKARKTKATLKNKPVSMYDDEFVSDFSILKRTRVSLSGLVRDYEMKSNEVVKDAVLWLRNEDILVRQLYDVMTDYVVKGRLVLKVWFTKCNPATGQVLRRDIFHLSSQRAEHILDFQQWYDSHVSAIIRNLEAFHNMDSDLTLDRIEALDIKFSLTKDMNARGFFELPGTLKRMQAVINVDTDEACFKYALLSILHYDDVKANRQRKRYYHRWFHEINLGNIDANNVNIKTDLPKIEDLNNLKINIHVWDKGLQGCRYNRRSALAEKTVNLLLVVASDGRRHYCGIPSLSRLYNHTRTSQNMRHICERCIRSFHTIKNLQEHFEWCSRGRLQIERMPKNKHFSYTQFEKELSPLKVVYADIESYIQEDIHYPAAIASYEVWHNHLTHLQANTKLNSWIGEDSISQFLQHLEETVIRQQRRDNKMTRQAMLLTTQQEKEFAACTACPRCHTKFDDEKHKKVRDHCHIKGTYRGPLCHKCNILLRLKRRILPVVFHNFKCYDAHIIIKHGLSKFKHWKLDVIPQTKEKYMTLSAKIPVDKTKEGKIVYFNVVFLDSFQFMPSSLANLVKNLDELPFSEKMKTEHPNLSDDVIKRKGVFPYSYLDSLDRLKESSLPPREAFKNDLTGDECSEDDYLFAQRAWQEFNCQQFEDFLLCYLKMDVLQLADIFEKFRETSLKHDKLDPVHFISLPGLSFSSAFKMTNERVDLIQDPEMYTLFERGIRGGMTFVNKHIVRHENIDYNNELLTQHLAYIDQNNLYGSSLCKPLPHSEFSWVDDLTIFTHDFILKLDEEGEWGYTLEIDLDYPANIHHKTIDFPLAPEQGEVTHDMFTPFMKTFHETLNGSKEFKSSRKLLLTQFNRERYVLHFVILKFYLEMGMVIKTVHRVIKYKQKRWLKPYIDFNSKKRALASNRFEKDFYKFKNNALFGKTMEDVRKRINYKLVNDESKLMKLISSPFFNSREIINEEIVGVHMVKSKVTLDKAIYVGQSVLDYSKLEMYNLYYKILPKCPLIKKLQLIGGDTDSFFLAIATDTNITLSDVFNNLAKHIDTSNYPPSHPMYSIVNKAKLGCFKDETAGQTLEEMILLRPKMYSMKFKDTDNSIKRAKGITKHIVKNMKHDIFKNAFEEMKTTRVQMTIIRSTHHTLQTTTFSKRALSAWEDKRLWLNENESIPHGCVDSPIPPPKRRRVMLPPAGDVY